MKAFLIYFFCLIISLNSALMLGQSKPGMEISIGFGNQGTENSGNFQQTSESTELTGDTHFNYDLSSLLEARIGMQFFLNFRNRLGLKLEISNYKEQTQTNVEIGDYVASIPDTYYFESYFQKLTRRGLASSLLVEYKYLVTPRLQLGTTLKFSLVSSLGIYSTENQAWSSTYGNYSSLFCLDNDSTTIQRTNWEGQYESIKWPVTHRTGSNYNWLVNVGPTLTFKISEKVQASGEVFFAVASNNTDYYKYLFNGVYNGYFVPESENLSINSKSPTPRFNLSLTYHFNKKGELKDRQKPNEEFTNKVKKDKVYKSTTREL
jgi:hypothetical protein